MRPNYAFERSVMRSQVAPWAQGTLAPTALDSTRRAAAQRER